MWIEINIASEDARVRVSARGSRGEQTDEFSLGPAHDLEALERFAEAVRAAASYRRPLGASVITEAQAFHAAIFSSKINELRTRLSEGTRLSEARCTALRLRLILQNSDLQAVPWESLCAPGEAMGFLASSPDLLPVRGITTTEPWQPRIVRSALRVLAIAPTDEHIVGLLRATLRDRIDSGEIEWLDPIVGPACRPSHLLNRLRGEPAPHVLHFIGHGGPREGKPALQLANDEDGEEMWLPVELLAQHLRAHFREFLRLIVLESCEGARPSVFASAGEILARAGASAVVAHLWPVRADVAHAFSKELYRSLAGRDRNAGDIAVGMNEARRAVLTAFEGSAEAFSPVVYLRGSESVLFDFKGRNVVAPSPRTTDKPVPTGIGPALGHLLAKPFSLLLGDRFRDQRSTLAGFREKLLKELAKTSVPVSPALPMSILAQRFALHRGRPKLGAEFQRIFRASAEPAPFFDGLARFAGPGVHTTLLRYPWFEVALAARQPNRTIYAIQPNEGRMMVLRREARGGDDWEDLDSPPKNVDLDEEIVILRPYGGYTPDQVFARPLMTEDDYALGMRSLEDTLPRDLANAILTNLSYRPALLMGLAVHTGHHRLLLHRIYPRGIPRGSIAVVDPEDAERSLWTDGVGLPGKDEGVEVVDWSAEDLGAALEDSMGKS